MHSHLLLSLLLSALAATAAELAPAGDSAKASTPIAAPAAPSPIEAPSPIAAPAPVPAPAPRVVMDTAQIHKYYLDGDFDQALQMLEDAFKSGGTFTHVDSVFALKHMGVMYAAKYETREKGKQFMTILLQAEPTARIMDMYASDMIYMIFKNVQDEFAVGETKVKRAQDHLAGNAQTGEAPVAGEVESRPARRKLAWVPWTAGAVVLVGGVFITYFMLTGNDTRVENNRIP